MKKNFNRNPNGINQWEVRTNTEIQKIINSYPVKWTNKFRELGKKKGSRQDFIKLYKEMKKDKDKNKESLKTEVESWKDLVEENKN